MMALFFALAWSSFPSHLIDFFPVQLLLVRTIIQK